MTNSNFDFQMDELAFMSRALVSNRFTWDNIKSTVRELYRRNDQDIVKVLKEVKSNPTLKALYKDYLLLMFARERIH